ncbi:MAG: Suppressor of sigma54-dependent transcription, PspA-like, partial [uncultured Thermomicrobiales bacterium]
GHHGPAIAPDPRQRQRDDRQGRRPGEDARPDPAGHAVQHHHRPRPGGGDDRPGKGTRGGSQRDARTRRRVGSKGPAGRGRRQGRPRARGATAQARQRGERQGLRATVPGPVAGRRQAKDPTPAARSQVPDDAEPKGRPDRPPTACQGPGPGRPNAVHLLADGPVRRTGSDGAQDPQRRIAGGGDAGDGRRVLRRPVPRTRRRPRHRGRAGGPQGRRIGRTGARQRRRRPRRDDGCRRRPVGRRRDHGIERGHARRGPL